MCRCELDGAYFLEAEAIILIIPYSVLQKIKPLRATKLARSHSSSKWQRSNLNEETPVTLTTQNVTHGPAALQHRQLVKNDSVP